MSDLQVRTAVRSRLRYDHAGFEPGLFQSTTPSTQCQKRYAKGGICGKVLDAAGKHAVHCNVGGGVEESHDEIVTWLAGKLTWWTGRKCLTEQFVPAWDEWVPVKDEAGTVLTGPEGRPQMRLERARLDVQFFDVKGKLTFVDVHVVSAQSVNPERVRAFAAKPGSAAEAGERDKRRRYKPEHNPRAALVPFVVEALGRPGPQAMQLLRAMAPHDPTVRGLELTRAWAELSTLIQVRRANLLLASEYTHDVAVQPRGGGVQPRGGEATVG